MGFCGKLRGMAIERRKQPETAQDIVAFRAKEKPSWLSLSAETVEKV